MGLDDFRQDIPEEKKDLFKGLPIVETTVEELIKKQLFEFHLGVFTILNSEYCIYESPIDVNTVYKITIKEIKDFQDNVESSRLSNKIDRSTFQRQLSPEEIFAKNNPTSDEERIFDDYRFEVFSPKLGSMLNNLVKDGYLITGELNNDRYSLTEKGIKAFELFYNNRALFKSDFSAYVPKVENIFSDYVPEVKNVLLKDEENEKDNIELSEDVILKKIHEQPLIFVPKLNEKEFYDNAKKFEKHFSNTFIEEKTNPTSLAEIGRLEKYKRENPKPKKFFYDTEFLEGTQKKRFFGIPYGDTAPTIDLISIGIVSDDGREYYAISKDFNLKEAWNRYDVEEQTSFEKQYGFSGKKKYWIRENVLYPIFYDLFKQHNKIEIDDYFGNINNFIGEMERPENKKFAFKKFKSLISLYGKSREQISEDIYDFCINYYLNPLDIYNLKRKPIELWGYYADYDHVVFCWLFGKMLNLPEGFPMYTKDLKQSYDFYNKNFKKRKALSAVMPHLVNFESLKDLPDYPKQENEHNALADARWNKKLYEFLKAIK